MKRDALKQLIEWKNSKRRKPLILQGARQVGKTWLMQEFGRQEYKKQLTLVYKVTRISKPNLPIRTYENIDVFKLYIVDAGLLGALSNLKAKTIINGNNIFTKFKGVLTEQYVLQQLKTSI